MPALWDVLWAGQAAPRPAGAGPAQLRPAGGAGVAQAPVPLRRAGLRRVLHGVLSADPGAQAADRAAAPGRRSGGVGPLDRGGGEVVSCELAHRVGRGGRRGGREARSPPADAAPGASASTRRRSGGPAGS